MDLSTITVADFKAQFPRGFPYLPSNLSPSSETARDYVLDSDIETAFVEAQMQFNQGLFGTDAQITLAYLYLTAHYLIHDLKAAAQGLNQSGSFPVSGRRVGSVSENYTIPDYYLNDPSLLFYTTSSYGVKYLSFVMPRIVGNIQAIQGATPPL